MKILAAALRLYFTQAGKQVQVDETSLTRQCEKEYLAQLSDRMDGYDAAVSLACGCGIQYLAEMYNNKLVFPGVDTCFLGVNEERGLYSERCQACGRCILAETGGICPIARCSKRMLNGPCGGSDKGKCEVNPDIPCGWQLIYERLKTLGQLDRFENPWCPRTGVPPGTADPARSSERITDMSETTPSKLQKISPPASSPSPPKWARPEALTARSSTIRPT